MIFYEDCKVTLVAIPQFYLPEHLPCEFKGQSTDAEKLIEYGGRVCYMSQHNPAGRTTGEYISNIIEQRHGSVLEHANVSLLLEGISRSCSHELVRHRAGFSYSQLSQRFVDSKDCAFVVPPAMMKHPELRVRFELDCQEALKSYTSHAEYLRKTAAEAGATLSRKQALEAARSVLPNATETKMLMTGNLRAWRSFIELRASLGADAEIHRLAFGVYWTLKQIAPSVFEDFVYVQGPEGDCLKPTHSKV